MPKDDRRRESRRVEEPTLKRVGKMPETERAAFFAPLVRSSSQAAADRGESLALVRPRSMQFRCRPKRASDVAAERDKIAEVRRQGSLFEAPLSELEPTPVHMAMVYEDASGRHTMMCGDWETNATFYKWRQEYGEAIAIEQLRATYEDRYMKAGVVLALGTVAKRPKQWLLLGILRLNEERQLGLAL
jgi:hypothetical protein